MCRFCVQLFWGRESGSFPFWRVGGNVSENSGQPDSRNVLFQPPPVWKKNTVCYLSWGVSCFSLPIFDLPASQAQVVSCVRSLCRTHPRGCSHHPSFLAACTQRLFQSLKQERLPIWKVWPALLIGHDLGKPPGISRMHFLKCCSWWDGPFGFLQQQHFVALLALGHLGRHFLQVGADINVPSHVFLHQRIF